MHSIDAWAHDPDCHGVCKEMLEWHAYVSVHVCILLCVLLGS
jgi:hypothetical protein